MIKTIFGSTPEEISSMQPTVNDIRNMTSENNI